MKKLASLAIAVAMGGTVMLQSGCYGSFALVNKVYDWNGSVSNDKFTKSLVFWVLCIIPVYEVAAVADAVILNLIEFWSGSNPVSLKEGQHEEKTVSYLGKQYRMEATKNRLTITPLSGSDKGIAKVIQFDEKSMSWTYTNAGVTTNLATILPGEFGAPKVQLFQSNGKTIQLQAPANEAEITASLQAINSRSAVAQR